MNPWMRLYTAHLFLWVSPPLKTLNMFSIAKDAAESMQIAILRAVTAIPLHACCGVIMGYFFGLYAFSGRRKYLIKSLFLPMIFHAIYNFMTTLSLLITALMTDSPLITYARSLHRRLARLQNGKTKEEERKTAFSDQLKIAAIIAPICAPH